MPAWSPNVLRIVYNLQQGTRPIVNVMYHDYQEPPISGAQMSNVAAIALGIYAARFLPLLSDLTELQSVQVYSMASSSAYAGSATPVEPIAGQVAGEPLPLQSAAVLTWRTAGRGRSARGRTFISGWSEGSAANSQLNTGPAADLEAAAIGFMNDWNAEDTPLIVYSQYSEGALRPSGLVQPVTGVELRTPVFGSQRDRNQREASA